MIRADRDSVVRRREK